MGMSKRHDEIIRAIVDIYINDKEPIASTTLQDYLQVAISSATIRNEMVYLTKQGYLVQPHISSGRVPTNKAYRYYIDNIDDTVQLSAADKNYIKSKFDMLDQDSQRFLQGAAELFSDMFKITTIISSPTDKDLRFVNFNILKTGKFKVVIIAVTSTGDVHTRVVRLESEIDDVDIVKLAEFLNKNLCLVSCLDIDKKHFDIILGEMLSSNRAFLQLVNGVLSLIKVAATQTIHIRGEQYLVGTDRFEYNISNVLKILADKELVKKIVSVKNDNISVVFGDELLINNMDNVCFISKKYYVGSAVSGVFCVVCPQTVDYCKLFACIEYFTQLLSQSIMGTERRI